MKSYVVFESVVIGFLIGVVAGAYISYLDGSGGYMTTIVSLISFHILISKLPLPADQLLIATLLFVIGLFMLYGAFIGAVIKKYPRAKYPLILIVCVVLGAAIFEQGAYASTYPASSQIAPIYLSGLPPRYAVASISQSDDQYFGTEADGDLNGDGLPDIAFILPRTDPKHGAIYYLSAALAIPGGHQGTNIVYLGDGVTPLSIRIVDDMILVTYKNPENHATSTLYAEFTNGQLLIIPSHTAGQSLFWGTIDTASSSPAFEACAGGDPFMLASTSSWYAEASTSDGTVTAIFIGKALPLTDKSSSGEFSGQVIPETLVSLAPGRICP